MSFNKGEKKMNNDEKVEYLFDLFKEGSGKPITSLSSIHYSIEERKKYSAAKENNFEDLPGLADDFHRYLDFPSTISLNTAEIIQLISIVHDLKGNYFDNESVKNEIMEEIFHHVSKESIIQFFRSQEFIDLYKQSDWSSGKDFCKYYAIKGIYQSLTQEEQQEIYADVDKKERATIMATLGELNTEKNLISYLHAIHNSTSKSPYYIQQLELSLAFNDVDVDLSEYAYPDKAQEFFASQSFHHIINLYYQSLTPQERQEFLQELSYRQNSWSGSSWLRL